MQQTTKQNTLLFKMNGYWCASKKFQSTSSYRFLRVVFLLKILLKTFAKCYCNLFVVGAISSFEEVHEQSTNAFVTNALWVFMSYCCLSASMHSSANRTKLYRMCSIECYCVRDIDWYCGCDVVLTRENHLQRGTYTAFALDDFGFDAPFDVLSLDCDRITKGPM